jgi:hypothetical protein
MEKAFRICLSSISVFGLFLFLSGCGGTMQITDKVSNELKPDVLYKSYNIQPTDLSQKSECKMAPTVKLVNIENRTENFEVLRNPPVFTGYVTPEKLES